MANPEWGTKRQCPKCGTRFYDLGNDDPIVCIDCEHSFKPEIILKSKMTPLELSTDDKTEDDEDDLEILDEKDLLDEESDDDEDVEIDADDNTVVLSDDDDTNVADVVVKPAPASSDE